MKIYKKIIAIIAVITVLASSLLWLVPSASATVVNGTNYDWKVYQGQKTLSEYPDSSFEQSCYITVGTDDWKLSGSGSFGYDTSSSSFFVQIDKYAGSNGSWVLKFDLTHYWRYRDGLNDYGSMDSTWHSMKDDPKDIYITFGGLDINDYANDMYWISKLFTYVGTESYTLTFTGQGVTTFTREVDKGNYFTFPNYTREGYVLQGWTYVGNDAIVFEAGSTATPTADGTFVAVWKNVGYHTLTFTGEGIDEYSVSVTSGYPYQLPSATRNGYTFVGWIDEENACKSAGTSITVFSDHTYTALWQAEESESYDITFKGNGIDTFTVSTGTNSTTIIMPKAPERDGYVFKGWGTYNFTSGECECGYFHQPGETYDFTDHYYVTTFTAVWEKLEYYTYTFTSEIDGFNNFTLEVLAGDIITMPEAPEIEGYVFYRWECGEIIFREPGDTLNTNGYTGNLAFVGVYIKVHIATFEGVGFKTFSLNGDLNGTIKLPELPEGAVNEDYNFNGWTIDGAVIYKPGYTFELISDVTFTAVWSKAIEVTFQGEGLEPFTVMTDENGIVIMPPLPDGVEREGYTFEGWTEGAYIYKVGMEYDCVTNNVYTFTAKWKEAAGFGSDGLDDNGRNFIVGFFSDIFEETKKIVLPTFDSFEIPFVNVSLTWLVKFLFGCSIVFAIAWLISKARGN